MDYRKEPKDQIYGIASFQNNRVLIHSLSLSMRCETLCLSACKQIRRDHKNHMITDTNHPELM